MISDWLTYAQCLSNYKRRRYCQRLDSFNHMIVVNSATYVSSVNYVIFSWFVVLLCNFIRQIRFSRQTSISLSVFVYVCVCVCYFCQFFVNVCCKPAKIVKKYPVIYSNICSRMTQVPLFLFPLDLHLPESNFWNFTNLRTSRKRSRIVANITIPVK